MFEPEKSEETICALATPAGFSGVGLIRVSGLSALSCVRMISKCLPKVLESHRVYLGEVTDSKGHRLDQALFTYFLEGRSYTGEETVEISFHGNPMIGSQILRELCSVGCRMAAPGEFTYRAFMNGRIDLVQAESVLSLIQSRSRRSQSAALHQLRGGLTQELEEISREISRIAALVEVGIDFSTEDIEVVQADQLERSLNFILSKIERLRQSYSSGRRIHGGTKVAIVGPPNAGKSSLLNLLVKEERSIVSAQAGTTRDYIECDTLVRGAVVTYFDTAGLRETDDEVEKLGIRRASHIIEDSDVVVLILDVSVPFVDGEYLSSLKSSPAVKLIILNKIDLLDEGDATNAFELRKEEVLRLLNCRERDIVRFLPVSVMTKRGVGEIEDCIGEILDRDYVEDSNVLTQARHFELLESAFKRVFSARSQLLEKAGFEFLAFDLAESLRCVQEILGQRYDDQILDRVFKDFCIGK